MNRQDVYARIDEEREYQDEVWGVDQDERKTLGDWTVFLDRQVERLKDQVYESSPEDDLNALHTMRKIAAIAVACMEHNGCPPRP
jgi:hypothetical protein